ncbi:hypothetical protein BG015_006746 [Linnemannia schmuckeri]|uniref:Transmembrane protein 198 n=1 Tax=Linnemannia schmuckeri TaxID=64567 RepID=A0A9P5VBT3_9FUNG|nr:hypothetical protein BG015_006746 [Linnemannia schmuckeri]
MVSTLQPAPTSRRRPYVRNQPSTTAILNTFFLQICFLICTTVLTLTTPTHAYPLLAFSDEDDFSPNTNTLVNEANASNTPSVGNVTMEETYGRLILDVGQKTVISTRNWVLGIILIIVGLVQVFYGFKFIRLTLVLTGFISWAVISMIVTVVLRWDLVYFLFKPSHYYFWIWFLAGILGAILSFRYWDLGVAFSGGFGGFALAMGIIAAVNDSHNVTNTPRYILLAVLILLGAAVAIFYERFSIILGTSLGGSFMVMFGIDEFLQAGYREMIVIFDFAGRTLQYHPDKTVFIMIGCSLALACLGIAWEFWHHAKPLLVDRRALFRIYGRPFGKRPHKLAGQRLKRRVAQSDWYTYLSGCLCLRRRTAEEVLYGDDEGYDEAVDAVNTAITAGTTTVAIVQTGTEDEKTGSTSSESALETVVIVVDEAKVNDQDHPTDSKPSILPGTEIIYGSGIESSIHGDSTSSSSSSHITLTTQTATATGPVEVVITETSESVDEDGARVVTTTTTTTTTSSGEQHERHYLSTESRTQHSESTSFHHQSTSEGSNSSHAEMMMCTESSSASSSSQSTHMATTTTTAAARSMETSHTSNSTSSTSKTLLQSMAAAHHSSSSRITTTTTTSGSGATTVVESHSSSSS